MHARPPEGQTTRAGTRTRARTRAHMPQARARARFTRARARVRTRRIGKQVNERHLPAVWAMAALGGAPLRVEGCACAEGAARSLAHSVYSCTPCFTHVPLGAFFPPVAYALVGAPPYTPPAARAQAALACNAASRRRRRRGSVLQTASTARLGLAAAGGRRRHARKRVGSDRSGPVSYTGSRPHA